MHIFNGKKYLKEKQVYGRTTITNVHPKRPWMCFSDKYYRRKVDSLLSRSIRDPAVVLVHEASHTCHVCMCTFM